MWMLSLLLLGLAASSLMGTSDEDDGTAVELDGEVGRLREGDDGNNGISGTGGPDILSGKGGDDTLNGGTGDDALLGGEEDDILNGGGGEDYLAGGEGDDLLDGGADDDTLVGYTGNDTLVGGEGNDLLVGAEAANRDLEIGDFYTAVDASSPYQPGQAPNGEEANVLDGGEGDDALLLGEGDTGTGGEGRDVFQVGEWVDEDAPVITDFDPDEDLLSLLYERSDGAPKITIERTSEETHVLANDIVIARLLGEAEGFEASDVISVAT